MIRNISLDEIQTLIKCKSEPLYTVAHSSMKFDIEAIEKLAIDILSYCKEYRETLEKEHLT